MLAANIQPDAVTFAGVIDAHAKCRDGSAVAAANILDQMITHNASPNQIHFNSALNACASQRSVVTFFLFFLIFFSFSFFSLPFLFYSFFLILFCLARTSGRSLLTTVDSLLLASS
jgi:hypothetical protein